MAIWTLWLRSATGKGRCDLISLSLIGNSRNVRYNILATSRRVMKMDIDMIETIKALAEFVKEGL